MLVFNYSGSLPSNRNWTYCDKITRNNLPLLCHVRFAAEPPKNRQGSFYENFNNVSKHAKNSQYFKNGVVVIYTAFSDDITVFFIFICFSFQKS